MVRNSPIPLVIDARPRGPRGAFAVERVQGRSVLDHLLELAETIAAASRPVPVLARPEDQPALALLLAARPAGRFVLTDRPTPVGTTVLKTSRLYDPSRLRRAVRRGNDPESAVLWRLDQPHGLEAAGEEWTRRQSYQPIGRYWALDPACRLARALAPTRVRPNAVTLAAAALMGTASGLVAFARPGLGVNLGAAGALGLALVLDTADGRLARLQGTASAFGRWLDAWLDELADMALHAAIAWSAFARTGASGWLLVGMAYAMGKYVFLVGTKGLDDADGGGSSDASAPAWFTLRGAVHLAGHADVRWHLWIALAAIGRLDVALAAYAVYFPARSLLGAARKAAHHA